MAQFCCCCPTRTGALFIGTLGWILTLLQIFAGEDLGIIQYLISMQIFAGINQYGNRHGYWYESRYIGFESFRQSIYFKVGLGLVALLISLLLIVGVHKKDRRYILPWLVLKGLEATLHVICTGIIIYVTSNYTGGEVYFFVYVLVTVLLWYFWLCVLSHYKELGEPVPNGVVYSTENTAPPPYVEKDNNMA